MIASVTAPTTTFDVISDLAGVPPNSPLADLRAQRPEATQHAQGSYAALFETPQPSDLSGAERLAVAAHVAGLHHATAAQRHYAGRLGPSKPTGPRWTALQRHADLQALADAGLSTTAMLTLSQVIAFVSFQVRVIEALRLLSGGDGDGDGTSVP